MHFHFLDRYLYLGIIFAYFLHISLADSNWYYYTWDTSKPKLYISSKNSLPLNESVAENLICSTLSKFTAPGSNEGVHAIAADTYHPSLNRMCRLLNIPCIYTSNGLSYNLPMEWRVNNIDAHPSPSLTGKLLADLVRWLGWQTFCVYVSSLKTISTYEDVLLSSANAIHIRQLVESDNDQVFNMLTSSKEEHVYRYLVDISSNYVPTFFALLSSANMTSMPYDIVFINWITNFTTLQPFLFAGGNFSAIQLVDPLFNTSNFNLLSRSDRLRKCSETILSDSFISFEKNNSLLSNKGALVSVSSASSECKVQRESSSSFTSFVKMEFQNKFGTVTLRNSTDKHFDFSFDYLHLYSNSVVKHATWKSNSGFVVNPDAYAHHELNFNLNMKRIKLKVVVVEDPPFTIFSTKDSEGRPLYGNRQWSGLAVDLFEKIANLTNLRYEFHAAYDGKFGSAVDEAATQWNGMIGELMTGQADVAVASLTITYEREKVIDFTTPYMSLGLSILMKKPLVETEMFQFMAPFGFTVWLYVILVWILTTIVMFVCARLSPYEWYAQSSCVPVIENQFNVLNSLWFTVGSLMQQGSDLAPKASSTRMVGTVWWFFTLIMISSYTANLAAFLTIERMSSINSIDDLANQDKIKFGTLQGGSTYAFFKNSQIGLYNNMWRAMSANPNAFVTKTSDGIERVKAGGYAYILESTFNEYYRERDCSLMQVGEIFNPKAYAFGVHQGNGMLRDKITESILKLQKEQYIELLRDKWLKRYNVSMPCSEGVSKAPAGTLEVGAVGGVFVSLLMGLSIALLICIVEVFIIAISNSFNGSNTLIGSIKEQVMRAVKGHVDEIKQENEHKPSNDTVSKGYDYDDDRLKISQTHI